MAENAGKNTGDMKDSNSRILNPNEDDRLTALEIRLQAARARGKQLDKPPSRGVVLGRAFRLVSELVIGLVVGGAIGWYLDQWLGTTPIMLLIFFVLGVAAGVLNVMRAAKSFEADASMDENALNDHDPHDSAK
jgi:ATP synthase protein I